MIRYTFAPEEWRTSCQFNLAHKPETELQMRTMSN